VQPEGGQEVFINFLGAFAPPLDVYKLKIEYETVADPLSSCRAVPHARICILIVHRWRMPVPQWFPRC
jgi:hypothetical protein